MMELTNGERKRLLRAAKEIYNHKYMQIKGYKILITRTNNKITQNLLNRICKREETYFGFWANKIKELGGSSSRTRDWRVRIMMSVLQTKGYFEWAILGEEEGISDLAIQAGKIRDPAVSDIWARYAADERLHVEQIKAILGVEHWKIRGMIGEMILGANDGLVSILALVAGVAGGNSNVSAVLLAGIAGLVAGAISMGVSSYQSTKSEMEVSDREKKQQFAKGKTPDEEKAELLKYLTKEGFTQKDAEAIVPRILKKSEFPVQKSILDELGLAAEDIGSPIRAGILTGLAFAISALVPVLPFALQGIDPLFGLGISVAVTLAALFSVGAMKTIFSRKNWIRSGLEMMAVGAGSAAITYVMGSIADAYLTGNE